MKNKHSYLAFLSIGFLLIGCSVPPSSSSSSSQSSNTSEPIKRNVRKKTLDVYENKDSDYSIDTYFLDDIDAPYLKLEDVLKHRMNGNGKEGFPIPDYSLSFNNGILTASQVYNDEAFSISIDSFSDAIYSEHYLDAIDIFHHPLPYDIIGADNSPIIKSVSEKRTSPFL